MFKYTKHNGFDVVAFVFSQSFFTLIGAVTGGIIGTCAGQNLVGLLNDRYMFSGPWWNPNHGPACLFYKIFKI